MMIRDKNNIFERVENFHADLAWNYPLNNKLLLGGKSAREDRLQGFSFFPVGFPRILRPLAFSLGIQALEESISQAT